MTEPNGRWWRKPSFSVEDIYKWAFLMGPLFFFWLTLWLGLRDLVARVDNMPTNHTLTEGIRSIVDQGNEVHEELGNRIDKLERQGHKKVTKVGTYDWEK
jgi:hypothetical protein